MVLFVLHEAAAARARHRLPADLADLRSTQNEWRSEIRMAALRSKSMEQEIAAAAARLALYHRGGIKPSQVAQLLYHLSGLVSLPVIAAN